MRWLLLVGLIVMATGGTLLAQEDELTPGEWREKETLGLGFGLQFTFDTGLHGFVDQIITPDFQLHYALSSESRDQENIFGAILLTTRRTAITGSGRYFPNRNNGWFVGGGVGVAKVTQETVIDNVQDSTASLGLLFFDGGWQGWDGYYFTVNVLIGGSVTLGETDNTQNFSSANNRQIAADDFEDAKGFSGIVLGFGWFL